MPVLSAAYQLRIISLMPAPNGVQGKRESDSREHFIACPLASRTSQALGFLFHLTRGYKHLIN